MLSLVPGIAALAVLIPHGTQLPAAWPVLYIGPDQILPLTSFIGAAVGVLLMFWNRIVGVFRRVWKVSSRK